LLFWLHLICGVSEGLIMLILSVTGPLLIFEKQVLSYSDSRYLPAVTPTGSKLPMESLLEKVKTVSGARPSAISVPSSANALISITVGRDQVYVVDPYRGAVAGPVSPKLRVFYATVTGLHRWFGFEGKSRDVVKTIKGVATLIVVFLLVSGLAIWFPRHWKWKNLKAITILQWKGTRRGRNWNWHNAAGIWSAIPLLIIAVTGTIMTFQWANALLFRVAGTPLPQAQGEARQAEGNAKGGTEKYRAEAATSALSLNELFAVAAKQKPGPYTIQLRLSDKPAPTTTFIFNRDNGDRPQFRDQLTLDSATGRIVRWEQFDEQTRGRRWRLWVRFLHTGEALGMVGQAIAGLASAGGALLAWSGLVLSWIPYRNWRRSRIPQH
jgi:uncharacterized iron-regulated membrane protein